MSRTAGRNEKFRKKNKNISLDDMEHIKGANSTILFLTKHKGLVLVIGLTFLFFFGAAVCSYLMVFGLI